MENKGAVDPIHIWDAANAYLGAANELAPSVHQGGRLTRHPGPHVTCAAFSLELFLKCALAFENASREKMTGHPLAPLFQNLTANGKDAIAAEWPGSPEPTVVASALTEFDGLFVDWRYIYEKKAGAANLPLLQKAILAVRAALLKQHPELPVQ